MALVVNTNIASLQAWRNLSSNELNLSKSLERLSSGLRINRAADDAAGLAISESMKAQIRGLNQAVRNAQDGISMVQTAESAMGQIQEMLQRMRELATQAASDGLTDEDRGQIQKEMDQLAQQITYVANTTQYNNKKVISGQFAKGSENIQIQVGANEGEALTFNIAAMDAVTLKVQPVVVTGASVTDTSVLSTVTSVGTGLDAYAQYRVTYNSVDATTAEVWLEKSTDGGATWASVGSTVAFTASGTATLGTGDETISVTFADTAPATDSTVSLTLATSAVTGGINVSSKPAAASAITVINDAIKMVSDNRAELGAIQNRLEYSIANLQIISENLQAANSRIRDVDMAAEMANFTKLQILQQAGVAMLAQANTQPQAILQLLR